MIKIKKIIFFCAIFFSLFFLVVAEKKSMYCGQGWLEIALPLELKMDWFNGESLNFYDKDGFGVLTKNTVFNLNNKKISVKKIVRYLYDSNLVVGFISQDDELLYVIFEEKEPSKSKKKIITPMELSDYLTPINSKKWVEINLETCFYGRWDAVKIIILFILVLSLGFVVNTSDRIRQRSPPND